MRHYLLLLLVFLLAACTAESSGKTLEVLPDETPAPMSVPSLDYAYPVREGTNLWTYEGPGQYAKENQMKTITTLPGEESFLRLNNAFHFRTGEAYELSFELQSNREVYGRVTVTHENGSELLSETFSGSSEGQRIAYTFYNESDETWNASVEFCFFSSDSENTVNIKDFMVLGLDSDTITIRVNQIGYLPEGFKSATFSCKSGDVYYLMDEEGQIVYRGNIVNPLEDNQNGEYNYLGLFEAYKGEGRYRIVSETGLSSYYFDICNQIYEEAYRASIRFFTYQRCGMELSASILGEYGHVACHTQEAAVVGFTGSYKDVSGGWHDAGDYGRYVQTGVMALAGLLLSEIYNPSSVDDLNIPESGNGVADILDEARYELEWLLKLQKDDGTVYNKVTTKRFAGRVMPEDDGECYLLPGTTLTTNGFAGVMALAAILYRNVDAEFAQACQSAALKAGIYSLTGLQQGDLLNPEGFATGEYNDLNQEDERYFACAALYALTNDDEYLSVAKSIYNSGNMQGSLVADLSDYGTALLLKYCEASSFKEELQSTLLRRMDSKVSTLISRNYPSSLSAYNWGSNQHISHDVFLLKLAYSLSNNEKYNVASQYLISYIFGENGTNTCFLTGMGTQSPQHIHHRMSMLLHEPMKGALVGGVDQFLSEGILNNVMNESTPIAKRYSDTEDSYSTNEVAIFYNSALVLALSFFQ